MQRQPDIKKYIGTCTKCKINEVERSREYNLLNATCFDCKRKYQNKYAKKHYRIEEVKERQIECRKIRMENEEDKIK